MLISAPSENRDSSTEIDPRLFLNDLLESGHEYGKDLAISIRQEAETVIRNSRISLDIPVSREELGGAIFSYIRKEEARGAIHNIRYLRDFTRKVCGDGVFNKHYLNMALTEVAYNDCLPLTEGENLSNDGVIGREFQSALLGKVYAREVRLINNKSKPGTTAWLNRFILVTCRGTEKNFLKIKASYVDGILDGDGKWIADFAEPTVDKPTKLI